MKLEQTFTRFITNKWVLNIVAFLAVFNVFGHLILGNLTAVFYFVLFALLVRYFSKNMVLVLGIPLILVNLFAVREGMENRVADPSSDKGPVVPPKKNDKDKKNNKNKPNPKTGQGLEMNPVDDDSPVDTHTQGATDSDEKQGFEPGRRKPMGHQIDYASTIEDAYDELNNILGSEGIQKLTSDTQSLMKQQMQLAEAMKGMTPVIKQIAPMVENLKGMMGGMSDGKNGMQSVLEMAKKMSNK